MKYEELKMEMSIRMDMPEKDIKVLMGIEMLYVLFFRLETNHNYTEFGNEELLLKNWNMINRNLLSDDEIRLRHLCCYYDFWSYPSSFRKKLNLYLSFPDDICLFHFTEADGIISAITKNKTASWAQEREDKYLEVLNHEPEYKVQEWQKLENPKKPFIILKNEDDDGEKSICLNFRGPISLPKVEKKDLPLKQKLSFSYEEILSSAKEMDHMTGQTHRETSVLESILCDSKNLPVNEITIDGVVNLLGQVSAGKSVLAECIGYLIAKKGGKTVYLVNGFADAVNKVQTFRKAGIHSVVVASATESSARDRVRRRIMTENMRVSSILAEETLSFCALSAVIDSPRTNVIQPGQEPCFRIFEEDNRFCCPYFGLCPLTKYQNEYKTANVLVTTPAAFCKMRIGSEREYFIDYCLENVDLVVADESDRLMNQFDDILTYSFRIREFVKKATEFYIRYKNMTEREQEDDKNIEFEDVLHELKSCDKIGNRKINHKLGFSDQILNEFSSRSLFRLVQNNEHDICFSEDDSNVLLNYIEGRTDYIPWNLKQREKVLNRKKYPNLKNNDFELLNNQAHFIVETVNLERAVHHLEDFASRYPSFYRDLNSALGFANRDLSAKLSASFINGVLRIQYCNGEYSVHRQYALGRALLQELPLLNYEVGERPKGPNVLLMSGTGYCPGSFLYHIPVKPTYLLRAPIKSQEFLRKARFYFPSERVVVSGAPQEEKMKRLKESVSKAFPLVERCMKECRSILYLVNSYEQAEEVGKMLIHKFPKEKICYVVQNDKKNTKEYELASGNLESFQGRILVVPTVIVERGHNIVDMFSNAIFQTLMIGVRPMNNPSDLTMLNSVLSGQIVQEYFDGETYVSKEDAQKIRQRAYSISNEIVRKKHHGIQTLPEENQKNVYVNLFVTVDQSFGRLCRAANPEMMIHTPEVYFIDGAFAKKDDDYKDFLVTYLDELIQDPEYGFLAEALYGPIYEACKKGEKI